MFTTTFGLLIKHVCRASSFSLYEPTRFEYSLVKKQPHSCFHSLTRSHKVCPAQMSARWKFLCAKQERSTMQSGGRALQLLSLHYFFKCWGLTYKSFILINWKLVNQWKVWLSTLPLNVSYHFQFKSVVSLLHLHSTSLRVPQMDANTLY